jgi:hypothetical protein
MGLKISVRACIKINLSLINGRGCAKGRIKSKSRIRYS